MDNLKNQLQQTLVQIQSDLDQIKKIQEETSQSVQNLQEQYDDLGQQLSDELESRQWVNGDFQEKSILQKLNKLQRKKNQIASQLDILEGILKKEQDTNSSEESDQQILKRKISHFNLDDDLGLQVEGLVKNLNDLSLTKKKVKFDEEQQMEKETQIPNKQKGKNTRSKLKWQKKILRFWPEMLEEGSNFNKPPLEKILQQQTTQGRIKLRDQLIQQREYYQYKEQYLNEQLESNLYDNDLIVIDCDNETCKQMNQITELLREADMQQQSESDQIEKLKNDIAIIQKTLKNLDDL
ncbi:hypothetical protein pb186bvf_010623 [Paramecium bursaria]